jgi:hypothetical protein
LKNGPWSEIVRFLGLSWIYPEIKDYVVLPRGQDNYLPPRPLILYFTMPVRHMTVSVDQNLHRTGQLTHTRSSDGSPHPDGALKNVVRPKITRSPKKHNVVASLTQRGIAGYWYARM